jgi:hypothetical protein
MPLQISANEQHKTTMGKKCMSQKQQIRTGCQITQKKKSTLKAE